MAARRRAKLAGVARWTCPHCHRQFGRTKQSHDCAPAMTIDEYFSTGPERERPIFDAVIAHLDRVGPVHVEPLSVGIFLKTTRTFAQLRPKTKWVALSFSLARTVDHPRIGPRVQRWANRHYHVFNLRDAADLDDEILGWLTESYLLDAE
jgi:hypothetical protein